MDTPVEHGEYDYLAAARERHMYSDEIEVDDDAKVSYGDYGAWVQVWEYVRHPDADA